MVLVGDWGLVIGDRSFGIGDLWLGIGIGDWWLEAGVLDILSKNGESGAVSYTHLTLPTSDLV